MSDNDAAKVVSFWREAGPRRWFARDPAFDASIRERFEPLHRRAALGELAAWGGDGSGALARLLLLDQFPRNMYRGQARAFATDALAREAAQSALARGFDLDAPLELQPFFYLPLEHQEDRACQRQAVERVEGYVARGGNESYLRFARLHAAVIGRFGRFPHRNAVLGRVSTPEELDYLASGGFRG